MEWIEQLYQQPEVSRGQPLDPVVVARKIGVSEHYVRGTLLAHGPEILRPRERQVPRMANATSPLIEQRVVAFALGHPGFEPARIAAELARPTWGGISWSPNGVWRVLRRHGLSTRARRYGLVAGYAAPPAPERFQPPPERHLDVEHPGQLVQLDCFASGA